MALWTRPLARTAALAAAALLGGCATHDHGSHGAQAAGANAGMSCPMHADMHQKMAAAKTPEERQALMAEHRKGMGADGGMACPMMKPAAR